MIAPVARLGRHPRVDPLLDLAQAKDERSQQGEAELGVLREEGSERVGRDLQRSHRLDGSNRGHPRVRSQQCHLTEDVARPEPMEPATDVDLRLTFEDYEHAVGPVAPREDHLARPERDLVPDPTHPVEVATVDPPDGALPDAGTPLLSLTFPPFSASLRSIAENMSRTAASTSEMLSLLTLARTINTLTSTSFVSGTGCRCSPLAAISRGSQSDSLARPSAPSIAGLFITSSGPLSRMT
jgi:hypothetical protein